MPRHIATEVSIYEVPKDIATPADVRAYNGTHVHTYPSNILDKEVENRKPDNDLDFRNIIPNLLAQSYQRECRLNDVSDSDNITARRSLFSSSGDDSSEGFLDTSMSGIAAPANTESSLYTTETSEENGDYGDLGDLSDASSSSSLVDELNETYQIPDTQSFLIKRMMNAQQTAKKARNRFKRKSVTGSSTSRPQHPSVKSRSSSARARCERKAHETIKKRSQPVETTKSRDVPHRRRSETSNGDTKVIGETTRSCSVGPLKAKFIYNETTSDGRPVINDLMIYSNNIRNAEKGIYGPVMTELGTQIIFTREEAKTTCRSTPADCNTRDANCHDYQVNSECGRRYIDQQIGGDRRGYSNVNNTLNTTWDLSAVVEASEYSTSNLNTDTSYAYSTRKDISQVTLSPNLAREGRRDFSHNHVLYHSTCSSRYSESSSLEYVI